MQMSATDHYEETSTYFSSGDRQQWSCTPYNLFMQKCSRGIQSQSICTASETVLLAHRKWGFWHGHFSTEWLTWKSCWCQLTFSWYWLQSQPANKVDEWDMQTRDSDCGESMKCTQSWPSNGTESCEGNVVFWVSFHPFMPTPSNAIFLCPSWVVDTQCCNQSDWWWISSEREAVDCFPHYLSTFRG